MVIAWRVVAIVTNGTQVVVEEGLTEDHALEVAAAMLRKGHNVIIEAEPSQHSTRVTSLSPVWSFSRSFLRRRL